METRGGDQLAVGRKAGRLNHGGQPWQVVGGKAQDVLNHAHRRPRRLDAVGHGDPPPVRDTVELAAKGWDCQRFDTRGAFFMPEADQGSALLEETWRQRVGLGDRSQAVGGDPGQPPIADHDLGEGLVLRIRFEEVRCIHERIGFDERPQLAPVLAGT